MSRRSKVARSQVKYEFQAAEQSVRDNKISESISTCRKSVVHRHGDEATKSLIHNKMFTQSYPSEMEDGEYYIFQQINQWKDPFNQYFDQYSTVSQLNSEVEKHIKFDSLNNQLSPGKQVEKVRKIEKSFFEEQIEINDKLKQQYINIEGSLDDYLLKIYFDKISQMNKDPPLADKFFQLIHEHKKSSQKQSKAQHAKQSIVLGNRCSDQLQKTNSFQLIQVGLMGEKNKGQNFLIQTVYDGFEQQL